MTKKPRSAAQREASRRYFERYAPRVELNRRPSFVDQELVGSVWYEPCLQIALSYEHTQPDDIGDEWIVGRTFWRGPRCHLVYDEPLGLPRSIMRRVR